MTLLYASLAGIGTWSLLNRHDVRGDYALGLFTLSYGVLYFMLQITSDLNAYDGYLSSLKLSTAYVATLSLATVSYRLSPFHPLASFPGPVLWRLSSLLLSASSFRGYRHLTLDALHRKYGQFVRIGPNHLSIHSPSAAAVLYSSHNMEKSHSYDTPGHTPGISLFFKHPRDEHAARKRIWSAGFTGSAYAEYCYPMDRRVSQLIQCLQDRAQAGHVDLAEALAHWSYDFMGEMVFGGFNDLELMRDGDKQNLVPGGKMAMSIVDSIGQSPWLLDILWHLPASKDIHQLRHAAIRMMQNRIASKDVDIRDVSSYLLAGDPATGEHIPANELAVDALVAVQAGSDNTATLLGLAFYFLLSDTRTYYKLQLILDAAMPNPKDDSDLNVVLTTLSEIPYLNAVLNETLRLGTPFFLPRIIPEEGAVIDGVHIPGGTIAALSAWTQQTCEENFGPDAMVFRPERWLEDQGATLAKFLVPFSSGRFVCIAKTFALHELRFVLARLMLNLHIRLKPGFDVDAFRRGIRNMRTTVFDERLMVEVEPRPRTGM